MPHAACLASRFLLLPTARSSTRFFSSRNSTAARCRALIRCGVCMRGWASYSAVVGGGSRRASACNMCRLGQQRMVLPGPTSSFRDNHAATSSSSRAAGHLQQPLVISRAGGLACKLRFCCLQQRCPQLIVLQRSRAAMQMNMKLSIKSQVCPCGLRVRTRLEVKRCGLATSSCPSHACTHADCIRPAI